ncbi:WecB/TagA/CpsF family glycosyltransferase, partial [Amylibacter sp.]|nr:WecB/TagA/CpsF family glycosyltransferase [Amylibacter sp.]
MKHLIKINTIFNNRNIVCDVDDLDSNLCGVVSCINPHSLVTSLFDSDFFDAINKSDHLLIDGVGAYVYGKVLNIKCKRITGSDFFDYLRLNRCAGKKVLFLGSTDNTLRQIQVNFQRECQGLVCCDLFSPSFKSSFTKHDVLDWAKKIDFEKYDFIFLGLTAPKQEKLSLLLSSFIRPDALIVNIGAVFDYYSGVKPSPVKVIRFLGLEWLHRFFLE